jgi:hypothetical protein
VKPQVRQTSQSAKSAPVPLLRSPSNRMANPRRETQVRQTSQTAKSVPVPLFPNNLDTDHWLPAMGLRR